MIKDILKDLRDLRDEMLSVNWPAQNNLHLVKNVQKKKARYYGLMFG